jgi:hypothetical protein
MNETAVPVTNLAQENPMNSIRLDRHFTTYLISLLGLCGELTSGFAARIILAEAVNSKLSFF